MEKAERAPTTALAEAWDQVLATDGALARLLALIEATAQQARAGRYANAGTPGSSHSCWSEKDSVMLKPGTGGPPGRHAPAPGRHDEDPRWLAFWDEADLASCETLTALYLGELAIAQRCSRTTLATVAPEYRRNRAGYLVRQPQYVISIGGR